MIVITGATGALNGATVEHLLGRVPADQIGVSVRSTDKARHFADRCVRVHQGSCEDPAALRHSFEGAEQVLLVSSNDPHADAVALHRVGIQAAVQAGAQRIVYTSHQGAGADSPFHPARDHAATEQLLAESGIAWTSLRNGFYAHSLGWTTRSGSPPRSQPGTPEVMARMTLTTFQAAREGRFAGTGPLMAELLGREPRTIANQFAGSIPSQAS